MKYNVAYHGAGKSMCQNQFIRSKSKLCEYQYLIKNLKNDWQKKTTFLNMGEIVFYEHSFGKNNVHW